MRWSKGAARGLVAGAMILLAGCATLGGGAAEAAETEDRPLLVEIENQNWALVDVYAVRQGLSIRLGSVTTGSRETFRLPEEMRYAVGARLLVEPLASRQRYVSPPIGWEQDVKLTVANQISLSTLVPWRSGG